MAIAVSGILSAAPSSSQVLPGRVLDESTDAPVAGAVVSLIDPSGERVASALTRADGSFVVRIPERGRFTLRVDMIGRRTVETEPFEAAAELAARTLRLPVEPIALAGIDVTAEGRCRVGVEMALATQRVWDEVEKALRAESLTREQVPYDYRVARTRRVLRAGYGSPRGEWTREHVRRAEAPFNTLRPEVVERGGYARQYGGTTAIYGPDNEVLLSPGFRRTHCFRLIRASDHPGAIGLGFEPVPDRGVTDIEGVLWLDEETAELRALEFEYRDLPSSLLRGTYSGFVEFDRLPAGTWIVRRWWLRTPVRVEEAEVLEVLPTPSPPPRRDELRQPLPISVQPLVPTGHSGARRTHPAL